MLNVKVGIYIGISQIYIGLFVWMGTETGADGGGILQMCGIKHLWYQKFAIPSITK